MPKYYVTSGSLKEIVQAESPEESVERALGRNMQSNDPSLGFLALVSEIGFDLYDDQSVFISTTPILKNMGLADKFFIDEDELSRLLSSLDKDET